MPVPVRMPQLGESVVEGTLMTWLKQVGEPVAEFEPLVEINSDKVAAEIPAPASGILLAALISPGTTVAAGTLLGWVGAEGEALPTESPQKQSTAPAQPTAGATAPIQKPDGVGFISPVVARMAQEHQIDLRQVQGSGQGGRITRKDVEAYLLARADRPAWEEPGSGDLFRAAEDEHPAGDRQPLDLMRRQIAAAMLASSRDIPQVTTFMEADLTAVLAHQEQVRAAFERDGIRLTLSAYFVHAAAAALAAFPVLNSSWADDAIQFHRDIHVGVAVSLGSGGLIVPVIAHANERTLAGLARSLADLSTRARAGRLQPQDVQGGTFTITNHGIGGSLWATPLVNPPQCAILGVGALQKRIRVLENDAFAVRPMVYLSLSFDHRILDGAIADQFLAFIVRALQDWPAA
jgi:2-oxoglutarate dehydrogenase E2 component (dihydrolipoamide succinyltransferase)